MQRIVFFTPVPDWFISEQLWSLAAIRLAKMGYRVAASIDIRMANHPRTTELREAGVQLQLRPRAYRFWQKSWHRLSRTMRPEYLHEVRKLLEPEKPDLTCIEAGYPTLPVALMEYCANAGIPYISTTNGRDLTCWPDDGMAIRHRAAFSAARRNFFVSRFSWAMTEKQLGCDLPNSETIWAPYNVAYDAAPAWPESETLRLACVGRLEPFHKGQDLLLEALARAEWRDRDWHLSLYGKGNWQNSLERIAARLGVQDKVTFAGHWEVEKIWAENHALVLPTHSEALCLVVAEALLCARPVLAPPLGRIAEMVSDGETGFLIPHATTPAVAAGLERLWANRANLRQMGQLGAVHIREQIPRDPVGEFTDRIVALLQAAQSRTPDIDA